jgi:hypothetical protein
MPGYADNHTTGFIADPPFTGTALLDVIILQLTAASFPYPHRNGIAALVENKAA